MKSSRIPFPVAAFLAAALMLAAASTAAADTVKITPLGSHEGELCPFDRAMILEDPDGTRCCTMPDDQGATHPRAAP